jgi:hypothetical protein
LFLVCLFYFMMFLFYLFFIIPVLSMCMTLQDVLVLKTSLKYVGVVEHTHVDRLIGCYPTSA